MQKTSINLTSKEFSFMLYALRTHAFKEDSRSIQEQAEAMRKKLREVFQRVQGEIQEQVR